MDLSFSAAERAFAAEVRQWISRRYAGDTIKVAIFRGDKRIEADLELVAKLEPYRHPALGVLPMRVDKGVVVRWVYPQSPAATAGIAMVDRGPSSVARIRATCPLVNMNIALSST